jgi:hypothetical protein
MKAGSHPKDSFAARETVRHKRHKRCKPPGKAAQGSFSASSVDNLSIDYLWFIAAIGRVLENAEETI